MLVTDEISLGDYVLTGGELKAWWPWLMLTVLPDSRGYRQEAIIQMTVFLSGLLEYPQYTRPHAIGVWSFRKPSRAAISETSAVASKKVSKKPLSKTPLISWKIMISQKKKQHYWSNKIIFRKRKSLRIVWFYLCTIIPSNKFNFLFDITLHNLFHTSPKSPS